MFSGPLLTFLLSAVFGGAVEAVQDVQTSLPLVGPQIMLNRLAMNLSMLLFPVAAVLVLPQAPHRALKRLQCRFTPISYRLDNLSALNIHSVQAPVPALALVQPCETVLPYGLPGPGPVSEA